MLLPHYKISKIVYEIRYNAYSVNKAVTSMVQLQALFFHDDALPILSSFQNVLKFPDLQLF